MVTNITEEPLTSILFKMREDATRNLEVVSSKTLVTIYLTTQHHIPEDCVLCLITFLKLMEFLP